MNDYWDESGLLKARRHEVDQNMLLRSAYYRMFYGNDQDSAFSAHLCYLVLQKMQSKGNWAQHSYTTYKGDRASHDEMTAIFYFTAIYRIAYYQKTTKVWKYLHQPQVFFFLLACKYKWKWAVFAAYLQMLISVSSKKRSANGKWDTDGSLLALLKIKTLEALKIDVPQKEYKILEAIKENWGYNYKKSLINEMLGDEPEHPLMVLVNE